MEHLASWRSPGCSIFLAVDSPTWHSPTVAIHALYLLLGFYAIHLLGRSGRLAPAHPLVSRGLFLLFAFNPSVFEATSRESTACPSTPPQPFYYVLAFLHLLLILKRARPGPAVPCRAIASPSLLLGLAYAAMVLTEPRHTGSSCRTWLCCCSIVVGDCSWRRHPPVDEGLTLYRSSRASPYRRRRPCCRWLSCGRGRAA